jgi:flagellin-like protein
MKNLRKSRKGLSPVVASIILIAVTVAVSIAVATWMGALVVGQMETEQVKITSVQFNTGYIDVTFVNQGSNAVAMDTQIFINGQSCTTIFLETTIQANDKISASISPYTWTTGYTYEIKAFTSNGNVLMYTAVA